MRDAARRRVGLAAALAVLIVLILATTIARLRAPMLDVPPPPGTANAVLVHVKLAPPYDGPHGREEVAALEARLGYALEASGAGRIDGFEPRLDEWLLYLYGDDADDVLDAVRPTLDAAELPPGSWANKRYGPPGRISRKVRVDLTAPLAADTPG